MECYSQFWSISRYLLMIIWLTCNAHSFSHYLLFVRTNLQIINTYHQYHLEFELVEMLRGHLVFQCRVWKRLKQTSLGCGVRLLPDLKGWLNEFKAPVLVCRVLACCRARADNWAAEPAAAKGTGLKYGWKRDFFCLLFPRALFLALFILFSSSDSSAIPLHWYSCTVFHSAGDPSAILVYFCIVLSLSIILLTTFAL